MTDTSTIEAFAGKMVGDLGAAATGALVVLGDALGLYTALAEHGPATPDDLAAATGTDARYVREWCSAQAAAGYIDYDAAAGRFALNDVQRMVFADEGGPLFMAGGFELIASMYTDRDKVAAAFRSGDGVGWHEHHPCLFRGVERFFRPGYKASLVDAWLPALDGVADKLRAGARVADIGCGHGASTLLMAEAFPNSKFHGFDYHAPSIDLARAAAAEAGVADRVSFETASAKDFPGERYDLACIFDALHDMGDPVGAARHVRRTLAPDGTWLIVEPFANDRLEDNLNPVGRVYYAASTMICTPASKSQEVGLALGAQAGETRLRGVLQEAGFARVRRAAETPFNLVLEARA